MIAGIRLENFKRFRDLTLSTANLTVLTGANGAGKTSVFHSLLLARQMARQPDRSHVELNGVDALELGGPEDVIHREASEDVAAVEVLDTEGERRRWSFRATSTTDTRTLNAAVVDRPGDYSGALAGPAPRFSYLCAERLGPRDVLGASAADMAELDVGSRTSPMTHIAPEADRVHHTDLRAARCVLTEVIRIGRRRPPGTWRFTLAGATGIVAPEAHAYLDPGAGSMLLQVLLGGLAGVGVLAKLYWHRVRELFTRREERKRKPGEQEDGAPER